MVKVSPVLSSEHRDRHRPRVGIIRSNHKYEELLAMHPERPRPVRRGNHSGVRGGNPGDQAGHRDQDDRHFGLDSARRRVKRLQDDLRDRHNRLLAEIDQVKRAEDELEEDIRRQIERSKPWQLKFEEFINDPSPTSFGLPEVMLIELFSLEDLDQTEEILRSVIDFLVQLVSKNSLKSLKGRQILNVIKSTMQLRDGLFGRVGYMDYKLMEVLGKIAIFMNRFDDWSQVRKDEAVLLLQVLDEIDNVPPFVRVMIRGLMEKRLGPLQ